MTGNARGGAVVRSLSARRPGSWAAVTEPMVDVPLVRSIGADIDVPGWLVRGRAIRPGDVEPRASVGDVSMGGATTSDESESDYYGCNAHGESVASAGLRSNTALAGERPDV